ncbi:hypothetical protein JCM3775_003382 [Rhodotorula graminis]|uniref:Bromo domain-containing protein n=1 Tax=Rhodotorula graminis (strain WP1) TaxID=578459 RepID=A0A0P9EL72_RHOGW|nr:uncharacterized protein RHOBADRAFT_55926 [Rhodotorula graminis WP1]KPV72464.1 hypothetical protein RHOBADRAFT_55926 [Rhodotorula graminis WP1]
MAVTAHATDLPVQQPLTQHPVVSEPPLEVALLLAQAVAQLGTDSWDAVTDLLEHSKEWPESAGKMTSQGYATTFETMMRQRGLDASTCSRPLARPARKLVHALYASLLNNLRSSILKTFDEEAENKQQIAALCAAHLSPSPPPSLAPKDDKRPQTPSTRKSARKTALPDVEEDADAEQQTAVQAGSAGPDVDMAVAAPLDDGPADPTAESSGTAVGADEANEPDEDGQSSTPSRRGGGRRKAGGRGTGRRKGRGGRAATVEGTETPASEQDGGEDTDAGAVKEEEDEDEAAPGATDEGEEGAAGEAGDGDEEEAEDASRPRRGGRKARAPAPAAKKGGRKRKPSEAPGTSPAPSETAEGGRKRKRVKTTEEPFEESEKDSKLAIQRRKAGFNRIIEQLQAEKYSHYFESRVTRSIAPLYNVAVRRPTCLRDVTKAIKSGAISTSTELMRDVALLCANATQFNGDEGEDSVGHCAKLMWDRFERLMDESLSAEMSME